MGRLEWVDGRRPNHACHLLRLVVFIGLHLAAQHRRPLDRRVNHSRQGDIHTEDALAGNDLMEVNNRYALADVTELGGILQPYLSRLRQRLLRG